MGNPLIEILGRTVLGNIWTTSIGGSLIWANIEKVAHMLAQNPTIGQLVMDSSFQSLMMGVVLPFLRDPKKLPQMFFKE